MSDVNKENRLAVDTRPSRRAALALKLLEAPPRAGDIVYHDSGEWVMYRVTDQYQRDLYPEVVTLETVEELGAREYFRPGHLSVRDWRELYVDAAAEVETAAETDDERRAVRVLLGPQSANGHILAAIACAMAAHALPVVIDPHTKMDRPPMVSLRSPEPYVTKERERIPPPGRRRYSRAQRKRMKAKH